MSSEEPTREETIEAATQIYAFAGMIAAGHAEEAVTAIHAWIDTPTTERDRFFRFASLASVPLPMAATMLRKHRPFTPGIEHSMWALYDPDDDGTPLTGPAVHVKAAATVLVRHLNDDHDTALALLDAHVATYGDEGMFWFSVEAIKLLAQIILSTGGASS